MLTSFGWATSTSQMSNGVPCRLHHKQDPLLSRTFFSLNSIQQVTKCSHRRQHTRSVFQEPTEQNMWYIIGHVTPEYARLHHHFNLRLLNNFLASGHTNNAIIYNYNKADWLTHMLPADYSFQRYFSLET